MPDYTASLERTMAMEGLSSAHSLQEDAPVIITSTGHQKPRVTGTDDISRPTVSDNNNTSSSKHDIDDPDRPLSVSCATLMTGGYTMESSSSSDHRSSAISESTSDNGDDDDDNNNSSALNADQESSTTTAHVSTALLGWYQVVALVHKNLLTKWRTPFATFMELFSPVLMMLVLVAAYQLSEITYKDAAVYASIRLAVPGPWLDLVQQTATIQTGLDLNNSNGARRRLFTQAPEELEPSSLSFPLWQQWPEPNDIRNMLRSRRLERRREQRRIQFAGEVLDDDDTDDDDDTTEDSEGDIYKVLNDARKELNRLLKNPLAVPSFPEYVNLSIFLSSLFDTEKWPRIFSDSSYGREWGNLLTLGSLHLSPDTARTRDFLSYLNESYPTLMEESLTVRLHETEQVAIRFIDNNLDERTWALLDFSSWSDESDDNVTFKIRMNYTTLPNTNEITDFVSIGLNKDYQRYYLSGFLTLQRTLNEFAFLTTSSNVSCGAFVSNVTSNIWSMVSVSIDQCIAANLLH